MHKKSIINRPKLVRRPARFLLGFLLVCASLSAQQPITFKYFYDDLNQLVKVIDSTGVSIEYVYDPVGNMVQIRRSAVAAGALTIFAVSPQTVASGQTFTIQGQGFSTTLASNLVTLNGVAAVVLSATTTTLVVQVGVNTTSGLISVTVGASTVTSSNAETVIPLPIISSVLPRAALAGTSFQISVTGVNLAGSTFSFGSPLLTVGSVIINPAGTSATLAVNVSSGAQGYYALAGINAAGSSATAPMVSFLPGGKAWNAISIPGSDPNADADIDGLTNMQEIALGTDPLSLDTDGDGWPDGLEVFFKSNPLDPLSFPHPALSAGWVSSSVFSMLNRVNPASGTAGTTQYISSRVFSLLDTHNPSIGTAGTTQYVSSPVFSFLNTSNPALGITGVRQYVSGRIFSMLNALNPSTGTPGTKQYVSSSVFSLLNTSNPATGVTGVKQYISSRAFSILDTLNPGLGATGSLQYVSGHLFSLLNSISPAPVAPQQHTAFSRYFSILNGLSLQTNTITDRAYPGLLAAGNIAARTAQPWQFLVVSKAALDSDGDGISDEDEIRLGTNPFERDTDHDGYPDGLEDRSRLRSA